jgi:hypothetical protein
MDSAITQATTITNTPLVLFRFILKFSNPLCQKTCLGMIADADLPLQCSRNNDYGDF